MRLCSRTWKKLAVRVRYDRKSASVRFEDAPGFIRIGQLLPIN
jgi:hypothetical protein